MYRTFCFRYFDAFPFSSNLSLYTSCLHELLVGVAFFRWIFDFFFLKKKFLSNENKLSFFDICQIAHKFFTCIDFFIYIQNPETCLQCSVLTVKCVLILTSIQLICNIDRCRFVHFTIQKYAFGTNKLMTLEVEEKKSGHSVEILAFFFNLNN